MTQLKGPCLLLIPVILVRRALTEPGAPLAFDPKTRLNTQISNARYQSTLHTHTLSFGAAAAIWVIRAGKKHHDNLSLRIRRKWS